MTELKDTTKIRVRFSEIDSMRRVWHGTFVKYFEDGRESFNRHFPGIDYKKMQDTGIYAPIYDIQVRCLAPLELNDIAVINTEYVEKRGARLDFKYEIFNDTTKKLCCKGSTTQLFIDKSGEQMYELPPFYEEWKTLHNL